MTSGSKPPLVRSNVQDSDPFTVKIWGVRGSIPTPGIATARYGGNTVCVEVIAAGHRLIFDGGTGLRVLGKHLIQQMPVQAHLFFTHTHWDRIQGFPFFIPAFLGGNRFDIYGAFGLNGASIKQRLSDQMLRPNFPAPLQEMRSHLQFHDIAPGSTIMLGEITIETFALSTFSGALGYRVAWGNRSMVYAIDDDPSNGQNKQNLLQLAHQTNLLIYDTAYTDHRYYASKAAAIGQHPEPWQAALDVAIATQAQHTLLIHHDPDHEDDFLAGVEADFQRRFAAIQMAREGMVLAIASQP
jgi:phosphoribosyl 1,2-cyclic phosphodiesterase